MEVKIRKGRKGDFIGSPFCLIDRRYQDVVREGEEWKVEVVRTIRDKRGKEIPIVKPVERIYTLRNDAVYCGEVEVGKPEVEKRRWCEESYGTVLLKEESKYYYEGKLVGEREEVLERYEVSDLENPEIPKEVRRLLEKIKKKAEEEEKRLLESGKASPEEEKYTKEKALKLGWEVVEEWKKIDPDKLLEEALKTHEETKKQIETEVFSKVREIYGIDASEKINLVKDVETLNHKEREYVARIKVVNEEGEVLAQEYCRYKHCTVKAYGDAEGPVWVGMGVDKDVVHWDRVMEESGKYEALDELYKKKKRLENLLPNVLKSQAKLIEKLKEDLEKIRKIKENIEKEVKIGNIKGWHYVRYPRVGESVKIPTLSENNVKYFLPPSYEDISEFYDLPYPVQMIEERDFRYAEEREIESFILERTLEEDNLPRLENENERDVELSP